MSATKSTDTAPSDASPVKSSSPAASSSPSSVQLQDGPPSVEQQPKPPSPPTRQETPPVDLISRPFTPFNHEAAVVGPFGEENARDAVFEQELSGMLLDLMLETHAWAAARPRFESELAVQKFEKTISEVMEVEKEQGTYYPFSSSALLSAVVEQTRVRMNEFVTRVRTALAALV